MIDQGVTAALVARDANKNGDESYTSGTGVRRNEHAARECTYPDFLKCKPLNFKGTEGVVGLTQYFEKMESVFSISNYTVVCQVKFATCTLQENALTWWNFHIKTTTPEVAHAMPWKTLKKMMTDKYCSRGEIKKIEFEMWNLKVEASDKVEKYVGGLPNMIHGSVMATKPKTMQDAIEFATELMDKKSWHSYDKTSCENRGTFINTTKLQSNFPRAECAQAYAIGTGERKEYVGDSSTCATCASSITMAPCTIKCANCKRVGPFKVLEQVEFVAYKLKLPQELSKVHNKFHVSNLRKCYADEPLAVPLGGLHLDNEL
ncbi:putative reverse transcriptase domain-containing protein [Tanacetum coccineum]|uniref:Reverse transcriptase domain-containing protein n=1 Tax=Tanacetum coccineum TaxID=301880 RepID=A0ABQ4X1V6_9ASTR